MAGDGLGISAEAGDPTGLAEHFALQAVREFGDFGAVDCHPNRSVDRGLLLNGEQQVVNAGGDDVIDDFANDGLLGGTKLGTRLLEFLQCRGSPCAAQQHVNIVEHLVVQMAHDKFTKCVERVFHCWLAI